MIVVRPCTDADRLWTEPLLFPAGPPFRVASKGVLYDVFDWPALAATADGRPIGAAVYRPEPPDCELLVLASAVHDAGAGSALIEGVAEAARQAGCRRLWLNTTNDNIRAIRFYQRRGLRLAALRPGAVDEARLWLKPEIPLVGEEGIRIRDELEFTMDL